MHRPPRKAPPMPRPGDEVRTVPGEMLRVGPRLGGGAQGSVFEVIGDPDRCLKVYGSLPAAGEVAVRERIGRLARLSERQPNSNLVLPLASLEVPNVGYVMPRVRGHVPIGNICEPTDLKAGAISIRDWYVGTGGLRKRLLLGQLLARSFKELHTRGLHYGDISFGNLLVSMEATTSLRLIDCDNLSVSGACDMGVEGTPWFIAPEILNGTRRPSAHTDAWSLAVILYHMLCLRHPLLGDAVAAAELAAENAALSGRFYYPDHPSRPGVGVAAGTEGDPLPWVDAPGDDRNRSTSGIGPRYTVSAGLMQLFDRAFGTGLRDSHRRPTEGEWEEALGRAVDAVLLCAACGSTSYLSREEVCPWCDAKLVPAGLLHLWHPDGKRPLTVERRRFIYPRHLSGRMGTTQDAPLAEVERVPDGLRVIARGADLHVAHPGRPGSPVTQRVKVGCSVVLQVGALFWTDDLAPRAEVVRP